MIHTFKEIYNMKHGEKCMVKIQYTNYTYYNEFDYFSGYGKTKTQNAICDETLLKLNELHNDT